MKKLLVTGSAGFIGLPLTHKLLELGYQVVGVDNHNSYYDPALKEARLSRYLNHPGYTHLRVDIADRPAVDKLFADHSPYIVVNLAAQAGVRYSIENPAPYIDSNLVGFSNILEGCRQSGVEHLIYASSSSVYGANEQLPFSVEDRVDTPISLYAATKRAGELIAHSYSHLYQLPTTGLRFFTVYGPWDRPDAASTRFASAMLSGQPIKVYNHGNHRRDFTYVEDLVAALIRVVESKCGGANPKLYSLYNIGGGTSVSVLDFIKVMEEALGVEAKKELLPRQPGDVVDTCADVDAFMRDFDFKPTVTIQKGISEFVRWYRSYYQLS
ncbi:MAG: NAD-dependent epimerase/dehydratase family protein [Bdellovibrionales bacterium]|jgi:UDP-glucuronate 4-epimerase|nr:NAD-dependent epimerase/dehydratase family protein [Bdellovibrionales bacterium]MBT3526431.1 NAD-dependent epimerase/dehydratase family protein [Bdellovibrionales bacterium]MBT7669969.1 NAD-dependent epimerase/dehydratase family protein [Bdellovibrionales bacterium]MBT7766412.1 NAD-dependent epimerase/dehydratase family protein [Bdellovibrionales bacterium]